MKIRTILFLPPIILLLAVSSCTPQLVVVKSRTLDMETARVLPRPTIVDLKVAEEKVTASATQTGMLTEEQLKDNALYEAVKLSNADLLVEPVYEVKTVDHKKTVTVIGFPATIKSFRPMENQDLPLLNLHDRVVAKRYVPVTVVHKSAPKGLAWLSLLALIPLFLLL